MATSGHAAADGDADDADGADDSGEEQRPKKAAKKDTAQELNGARIFTIAQDAASPVALRYPSSANVAKLTAEGISYYDVYKDLVFNPPRRPRCSSSPMTSSSS